MSVQPGLHYLGVQIITELLWTSYLPTYLKAGMCGKVVIGHTKLVFARNRCSRVQIALLLKSNLWLSIWDSPQTTWHLSVLSSLPCPEQAFPINISYRSCRS